MTQIQDGFKETEIGLIPEDWEVVEFGGIGDIVGGGTPPTINQDYFNGNIPWITPKDLSGYNSKYISKGERNISEEGLKNSSAKLMPKGTVLLTSRAPVGYVAIAENEISTNQGFKSIICNEEIINNIFVYYYLKNNTEYLEGHASGSTFKELSGSTLKQLKLPLPPLPEQKGIAEILSSLDDKIELLEKQNKTLENIGQALFKSWFVDFEPFSDDLVESEMGMIPRGWRIGAMNDILKTIESGKRPKGGIDSNLKDGIPSIGAENIIGLGNFEYGKNKLITKEFFETMKNGVIQNYDVLLYKDGASLGRSSMFGNGFPYKECCINEHVFILRTNQKLNQFYLYFWTTIQENKQAIINLNSNAAQPGINQTSVGSLKIMIPGGEFLKKYESIAKNNVDKIFENCLQIQSLSNLRDNLLPRLMSGKLRVV